MTITSIDKGTVRLILEEAGEALAAVAERHGVILERKHCTFSRTEIPVAFKFVVPERTEDGEAIDPKETEFRKLARRFGLQPDDYGKMFKADTRVYQVYGIKPKGRKYNVIGKEAASGKLFKFPAQQVKDGLEASAEEACG